MKNDMTEIILKLYEINETYHDKKERMAWVASTLYYGFSIAVVTWLLDHCLQNTRAIMLTVVVIAVYAGALSFISLQFKSRWDSVTKTDAHDRILRRIQSGDLCPTLHDFYRNDHSRYKAQYKERKTSTIIFLTLTLPLILLLQLLLGKLLLRPRLKCLGKKVKKGGMAEYRNLRDAILRCKSGQAMDSRYRSEIPTYSIATTFFITQLVIIWVL